jgi:Fe-S-cluster-containing dehydrogenase component
MMRFGMVIDVDRCIGCYNCFLACRDEHVGNAYPGIAAAQPDGGQKWIEVRERERGSFPKVKVSYVPVPCQHCAEAPCITAGKGGAVYRRADGIVMIDPDKAVGQRDIVGSCPYGVVFWNEAANLPQKCTMCAHLLDDGWKQPRCTEVCPVQAIAFGDVGDPNSEVARLRAAPGAEEFHPEYATKPLVSYRGLPRRFIAGEVVLADREDVAAEGVTVVLRDSTGARTTMTDTYGDFEFEGLDADRDYVLRIEHPGYRPREQPVSTRTDVNVGTMVLDRMEGIGRRHSAA